MLDSSKQVNKEQTLKEYLKKRKYIHDEYKSSFDTFKQSINDYKNNNDFSKQEKKMYINEIKQDIKNSKKDKKIELKKLEKPIMLKSIILTVLVLLLFLFCFEIYYVRNYKNYNNDYFAFRYNKDMVFINDYTEIANMWVVSTGGGIYAPTMILIGYIDDCKDMAIEEPLYKMQEILGGMKSEESVSLHKDSIHNDYILTINNLKYRILSKNIKKNNHMLTVMYVNAGDLNDKEQAYLYQVYDTIIIH